MDVAFYHDDPSNRLSASYDPQSSPGSVDSISSTDAGPVCAIARVPPAYRDQRYGQEFSKTGSLKSMNLQLQNGSTPYSTQQQQISSRNDPRYNNTALTQSAISSVASTDSYISSSTFTSVNQQTPVPTCSTSANNLTLNIPECSAVSASLSTPDLVNMLKVSPDFDQMLMQYSQSPQMTSQVYSRSLAQEQEMYAQNYAREVARQKTHGGSNPDLASSNQLTNAESSQRSVITSGGLSALSHPSFVAPDSYYSREQAHDGPSTSAFGLSGTTIHHIGNPNSLQPGQAVIMSPHVSMVPSMKDELPQTVPVIAKSRPMSPINMEQQEVIKTERKRMRNRLAASKCRKRKLERISRLEEKVNNLKNQNLELSTNANLLRQQVAELKSKVMTHVNSGCQLMMSQQQVTF